MQIVEIKNSVPVVSHRVVAEHCELNQISVRKLIDRHIDDLEAFGNLSFEMTGLERDGRGEVQQKTYHLTEPQATPLMTFIILNICH